MGWTGTRREKGLSDREFFAREFPSVQITDSHRGKSGVTWLRCEREKNGEKTAFILSVLTQWHPKDRYNFAYKDVDESMGPLDFDCPLRMLDGLPDPINEYSAKWRERVREYHRQQAARPKLEFGDVVKFDEPLNFRKFQADTFEKVRLGKRRNVFRVVGSEQLVCLTGLDRKNYHVVPKESNS